jgi:hypothetical protein
MSFVASFRDCIQAVSEILIFGEANPFDLKFFFITFKTEHYFEFKTLKQCFIFFCQICCPKSYWKSIIDYDFDSLLENSEFCKERSRFSFLLCFLVYFEFPNNVKWLKPFWFLMHYRGLSYTGFHILNEIGFGPSIRSLSKYFVSLETLLENPRNSNGIIWADNLRRRLKRNLPHDCHEDWTVIAKTIVSEPTPTVGPYATGKIFSEEKLLTLKYYLSSENVIDFTSTTLPYYQKPQFSNPLRNEEPEKFQFVEEDVLPVACGTLKGTISLLNFVSRNYFFENEYSVMTLDYDLYWRVHKLYFTSSIKGSFSLHRKKLILIMGPWHIYKTLSLAVWELFAPLILAPLWIETFGKRVPKSPNLREQLIFYISIANCTRRNRKWSPVDDPFSECTSCLIYELIPLVSLTRFI